MSKLLKTAEAELSLLDMGGQEYRACTAFALVGLAGELATEYGITGWQVGESINAALTQFKSWLKNRSRGQAEDNDILEQIRTCIDLYEDSKFTAINENDRVTGVVLVEHKDKVNQDCYGWFGFEGGKKEWLFTSSGLEKAVVGFNKKQIIETLKHAGWLQSGTDKSSQSRRIKGEVRRVYVLHIP